MQIHFTGHHIEVTDALRDFTRSKLEKLLRHYDKITSISVTFGVEKLQHIAEANMHLAGKEIHAKSSSEDMYAAIDGLIDKLDRQLLKHKQRIQEH